MGGGVTTPKKKTTKGAGTPKSGAPSTKGRERTVGGRVEKSGAAGGGDASPTVSVPGTPFRAGRNVGRGMGKVKAKVASGAVSASASTTGAAMYGGGSTEDDDDDDGENAVVAGGGTDMGVGMGVNPYVSMYGESSGADRLFSANTTGSGSGFNGGVPWDLQEMMGGDGMVPMTRGGMNIDGAFDGPDIGV